MRKPLRERVMTLLHALRNPQVKPADIEALDERLDIVDRRLEEEKRRRILQDRVDTVRRTGA